MTIPLTKEMLAAAYEFVRATPPFNKWNLPEPEDITFKITKSAKNYGHYSDAKRRHTIAISEKLNGYASSIIEVMAHEMLHVHEKRAGMWGRSEHSEAFKKLAAQVCKIHGFDPKRFS